MLRPIAKLTAALLAVLTVLLPSAPAYGQTRASAKLYTRVTEKEIRAAIEIEIAHGWHLYHSDLGHPKAVGKPTIVELSGDGITWGAVEFPEPFRLDQENFLDPDEPLWILSHEGTIVLHALGELAAGASGQDVVARLSGLTCDELGCVPYDEDVKSLGRGPDRFFSDATAGIRKPSSEPTEPAPTADAHDSGRADATVYTRVEGNEVRMAISIEVDSGWHLYHSEKGHPDAIGKPTKIELKGAGMHWDEPRFPEPHRFDQSEFGDGIYILGHEGTLVVYARGDVEPGLRPTVWAELSGQTCDAELCVNYKEVAVSQGAGPNSVWAAWGEGSGVAAAGTGAELDSDATGATGDKDDLAGFLLLAVFWGLFTLLMPCTYPMIPITISFFTKQAEQRGGKVLPLSLAYGAGIVVIFILIGALFGSVIIPFATHPVTNLVIGLAFLYFAFVLFGVFKMEPPRFMMQVAGKASTTGGFLGVFLMGATLVVTSFTCTAPFVGSLLSVGAADGDLGRIVLGMGVFGLTMALPFVFLSLVPGRVAAMPRSGQWMNTLKFTLGFIELAASMKFFSNSDIVWDWQILPREVFLLAWGVIFLAGALYLFGVWRFRDGKPTIGPMRGVAGALILCLSLYSFYGMSGRELDSVMTAIVPPYSHTGYKTAGEWTLIKDDYDEALRVARAENKLVFVNFTGHT